MQHHNGAQSNIYGPALGRQPALPLQLLINIQPTPLEVLLPVNSHFLFFRCQIPRLHTRPEIPANARVPDFSSIPIRRAAAAAAAAKYRKVNTRIVAHLHSRPIPRHPKPNPIESLHLFVLDELFERRAIGIDVSIFRSVHFLFRRSNRKSND